MSSNRNTTPAVRAKTANSM